MAQQPPITPMLQKPPGYRDPRQPGRPIARPSPQKTPPLPPSFRPKQKRRSCGSCCCVGCCIFCAFLLIVFIIAALAGGIFYLIFDPRLPSFYLLSFQIPKFDSVSKPDGAHLDVQAVASIELKNPNPNLSIYYSDRFEINVSIGDESDIGMKLGAKQLKPFTQRHRNTTIIKADVGVKNRVVDGSVGRKLFGQYKSKELRVAVEARTKIGYVIQGWRIGTVQISILCGGGYKLKTIEAGEMPKCIINTFKWINIR